VLMLLSFTQAFAAGTVDLVLRSREDGQTMAEYGVVLAVMTLAVLTSMTLLSGNVRSTLEGVANILPG
jgi:Flp pilus assembly pilin Flp